MMKVIGITGGIGSGKSEVLSYLNDKYECEVILADEVAHKVKEKGESCYEALVQLLGTDILDGLGQIDKGKMAEKIFGDEALLCQVNALIHPAVKQFILSRIRQAGEEGTIPFFFIEAALLIEDGYKNIVDELWYVYADEPVRRQRLKASRGYSDDRIEGILKKQLSEEEYTLQCSVLIDNSGILQDTYKQIDRKLEGYL